MTTLPVDAPSAAVPSTVPLLQVRNLTMHFSVRSSEGLLTRNQVVQAVDDVSFDLTFTSIK